MYLGRYRAVNEGYYLQGEGAITWGGRERAIYRDEGQLTLGFYGNIVLSILTRLSKVSKIHFISLPSWAKQINSEVGIPPFITGTDVLKVTQNQNNYVTYKHLHNMDMIAPGN